MRRWLFLAALLSLAAPFFAAEPETFGHVKIHRHRSAEKRVMVDKLGVLTFDDANRRFSFATSPGDKFDVPDKVEVGYDAVTKVVFEVTTHMRAGGWAQVISAASLPGAIIGTAIAGQHVQDYWFYFEYKNGDRVEQVLLEVPKNSSAQVIDKATSLFGSRVTVSSFGEQGVEMSRDELLEIRSKHVLKVNHTDRPVPEVKPDKATIVVVCPPLAARDARKGNQYKLHANGQVIAVNKQGTYSLAYLDPGKYRLASQAENAEGFDITLEAGQTYYFLQNTFQGGLKGRTSLSRNSPELVTYLMSGADFAEWRRK